MTITTMDLSEVLGQMDYAADDLTADTRLGPGGVGLDSLGVMELTQRIEESWSVEIASDVYDRMAELRVGDLLDHLNAQA